MVSSMKKLLGSSGLILFSLLTISPTEVVSDNIPCRSHPGDQGQGKVCVCDSSYCDTIERPTRLPPWQYHWYSTSNSTPGFSHTVGNFSSSFGYNEDEYVFLINSSVKLQEIVGFGGSFTDSATVVISTLPKDAMDKLIESYFGPTGIEYSMGRIPIGGSDFSQRMYTLDDVNNDFELQNFSLAEEDYLFKIPVIKAALAASGRGFKLYGCAWDAPNWMKSNDYYLSGYIRSEYLRTWAEYHIKFLQAYKDNGIDVWAFSGGNEVIAPFMYTYIIGKMRGIMVTAPIERFWVRQYLRPLLEAANLSDVKYLAMDDQRIYAPYWMDRLSADSEAFVSVEGIALHWYADWFSSTSLLDYVHNNFPNKLLLYTESSINFFMFEGKPVELGSWDRAAAYIYNIMENLSHWTNGYIDWNLALDTGGGPYLGIPLDAAVIVNESSGEFYKQPMFYGLGHFSKFIPPGSRRVEVKSNQNYSSHTANEHLTEKMSQFLRSRKQGKHFYPETGTNNGSSPDQSLRVSALPHVKVPSVVLCLATVSPDSSHTVAVFNSMNETKHVRIEDPEAGVISLDIEAYSVNTFVYWTN